MGEKIIHGRYWQIFLNKTNSLKGVNAYWKIILRRKGKKISCEIVLYIHLDEDKDW
jgi:hypothetical protein